MTHRETVYRLHHWTCAVVCYLIAFLMGAGTVQTDDPYFATLGLLYAAMAAGFLDFAMRENPYG